MRASTTKKKTAKRGKKPVRAAVAEAAVAAEAPAAEKLEAARGGGFWPSTPAGRRALLAIVGLAVLLRVVKLMALFPVLVDESIYLRWAEIIDHQGQWFISLLDGKQPLTYWILALERMIFGADPLIMARLTSVIAGVGSTVGIFFVGRLAGNERVGLMAGGLYAIFPFALLYDRIAYTEAFVNLAGVAVVLTSLVLFRAEERNWRYVVAAAAALGLGLWTKQTVLLFAFFPVLAAIWYGHWRRPARWVDLAVIYGTAGVVLFLGVQLTPPAPTLSSHDPLVHHTGFFATTEELMADPFGLVPRNFSSLVSYVGSYLTWPAFMGILAALAYLTWRRQWPAWLLLSVTVAPVAVQVVILSLMFPTRYPFPHVWPVLVVIALAVDLGLRESGETGAPPWMRNAVVVAGVALIVLPFGYRAAGMLTDPNEHMDPYDVDGFLGSKAHQGWGVREAVAYLENEAERNGPFVLLNDPIWGPPADAMAPFLNGRMGIKVIDAWWTQKSGTFPILTSPNAEAELIKSHYERESAGKFDFSKVRRVFYITDTNYYPPPAVLTRQPSAELVMRFPKPNQKDSIDIYRLK